MDKSRVEKYLAQIAEEATDMAEIVKQSDDDVLSSPWLIKSCKYSVIVISEAMANTLQHILARRFNVVVGDYADVFLKARQRRLLAEDLADRLQPFIRFRNILVHQYWRIDEKEFVNELRNGLEDFKSFVRTIRQLMQTEKKHFAPSSSSCSSW